MRNTVNALLIAAVIMPIVLLLWPFAVWNDAASVILRIIPAFAAQLLFCRTGKWSIIKGLPLLLTGALAAWGTYLYCTSDHWMNATFWGSLIGDYVSPFLSCVAAFVVCPQPTGNP